MSSDEAAVEAGAIAWFDRVQAGRFDPGAKDQNGHRWTWAAVTETDRNGYRALARPIVLAALSAIREKASA